jgi:hypothetical protein
MKSNPRAAKSWQQLVAILQVSRSMEKKLAKLEVEALMLSTQKLTQHSLLVLQRATNLSAVKVVLKSGLQRGEERPPTQMMESWLGEEPGLAGRTGLRQERQPPLGKKT